MKHLIFILLLTSTATIWAAPSPLKDSTKTQNLPDSNYIRLYKHKLVAGLFQSRRSNELLISQTLTRDTAGISAIKYLARASNITGFDLNYDKISFSFGWKTPIASSEIERKGKTSVVSYNLSFNFPHIRLENSFRMYTGFYDEYSRNHYKAFSDSTSYLIKPSLRIHAAKVKLFYFFNRKGRFSFMSSYSSTARQLKTAGSFFIASNYQFFGIHSLTSIIPNEIKNYYGKFYYDLSHIKLTGLSVAPGYSLNLVIRKGLFLNLTFAFGTELQERRLIALHGTDTRKLVLSPIAEYRAALGFNGKKFYITLTNMVDFNSVKHKGIKIENRYLSGGFTIGYRFGVKDRHWLTKLKSNKYYKML